MHTTSVTLFSMDSEQFWAAPTTTGGLKAYYKKYGKFAANIDITLQHFRNDEAALNWQNALTADESPHFSREILPPLVFGFSVYTWNAAVFLSLAKAIKTALPHALCIAGGPHVQQAEDYLYDEAFDVIVLGEGEETFRALLDTPRSNWHNIDGIAYLEGDTLVKTTSRPRRQHLDDLPSPLDAVPLSDDQGRPLYDAVSYETSRGCPFKCAFCEWGTGAIGGKMYQFSLARIKADWRRIIDAGIKDIWLADSNFGALREDMAKAEYICELKRETGLPSSFATSWSKKHSPRVQDIVRLLHRHKLLPHYQLALQTLTPEALRLSNRQNMSANQYQPIARQMAEEGIPIAAELIWGLPGDTLEAFETHLDQLLCDFPSLNIFAYTLLPGTEFYEKRDQYNIQTQAVAGYGKACGEYVIGCHSFSREEGLEGYLLITAYILFAHGHILPLTLRYLALCREMRAAPILRALLKALDRKFSEAGGVDHHDPIALYEQRAGLYLSALKQPDQLYQTLRETLLNHPDIPHPRHDRIQVLLTMDQNLAPRYGEAQQWQQQFHFDFAAIARALNSLQLPSDEDFCSEPRVYQFSSPGGLGIVVKDPDGGAWLKGEQLPAPLPLSSAAGLAVELH